MAKIMYYFYKLHRYDPVNFIPRIPALKHGAVPDGKKIAFR